GGPGVAARILTGKRLSEQPELKPLAKFADRKLTSVSYTSKALAAKFATSRENVEGSVELVEALLKQVPLTKKEQERIRKDLKEVRPFLKRFDEITRQRTLPALKDGQSGLVLEARLKSKEWIKLLGPTDRALPLFEPVYLVGVSDAEQLTKGLQEYRVLLNR